MMSLLASLLFPPKVEEAKNKPKACLPKTKNVGRLPHGYVHPAILESLRGFEEAEANEISLDTGIDVSSVRRGLRELHKLGKVQLVSAHVKGGSKRSGTAALWGLSEGEDNVTKNS